MDTETLTNLIEKMLSFGERETVGFCWHGGEPLLAGIDYYEKIVSLQNKLNTEGKKIRNSIQTNGTLINKNWADFFVKNNFSVGISLDGPKNIQNANRPSASGNESFNLVMMGLKLIQERGNFPSIISVTTSNSIGKAKDIFNFFSENEVRTFLPKDYCESDEHGNLFPFAISPDNYVDFLIEMFECWMNSNNQNIEVRNLYQIIKGIIGGKPNLCEYSGKCHLFLTIGRDGTIGACDSFPLENYSLGNINKITSIEDFLKGDSYKGLQTKITSMRYECNQCEWFGNVCGGGCMRHSYSSKNSNWGENFFCDPKKRLFSYIKKRIGEIQNK